MTLKNDKHTNYDEHNTLHCQILANYIKVVCNAQLYFYSDAIATEFSWVVTTLSDLYIF